MRHHGWPFALSWLSQSRQRILSMSKGPLGDMEALDFSSSNLDRARLKAASDLEIRPVGGEVIVHDVASGQIHIINKTAALVLDLCDGDRTIDDVAAEFQQACDIDRSRAESDVREVVEQFIRSGIV